MRRQSKAKISTESEDPLAVANPFADIQLEGLPETSGPVSEQTAPADMRPEAAGKSQKGRVDVRLEKSGRGGKTVTTLRGFSEDIAEGALRALAFDLKKTCACGGSLKGRTIELQGDLCERVIGELTRLGFRAIRSGG